MLLRLINVLFALSSIALAARAGGAGENFFADWRGAQFPVSIKGVAFGDGKFVAVGERHWGGAIHTSADGYEWTSHKPTGSHSFYGITYGHGQFVAVGHRVSGFSRNGADWTFAAQSVAITKVIPRADGYMAVAEGGDIGLSEDGLTWNFQQAGGDGGWLDDVVYANGITVVAGPRTLSATSDDVRWTTTTLPERHFLSVTFGNNLFVGCAQGPISQNQNGRYYTHNELWASATGESWQKVFERDGDVLYSVQFGNGLFIVAGMNGSLLYSLDGRNWVEQKVPFESYNLSFAKDRFFSCSYGQINSSRTVLALAPRPGGFRLFGPVGSMPKILFRERIDSSPVIYGTFHLKDSPLEIPFERAGFLEAALD